MKVIPRLSEKEVEATERRTRQAMEHLESLHSILLVAASWLVSNAHKVEVEDGFVAFSGVSVTEKPRQRPTKAK